MHTLVITHKHVVIHSMFNKHIRVLFLFMKSVDYANTSVYTF